MCAQFKDTPHQLTNDYAVSAKLSSVQSGFYKDAYLQYFSPKIQNFSVPEMNIGYFLRYAAIKQLTNKFYAHVKDSSFQIINIGCGFDTLYWRLIDQNISNCVVVDIDYESVILRKIATIEKNLPLINHLDSPCKDRRGMLHSKRYHFIGSDLGDLNFIKSELKNIQNFSYDVPTLVLAECVLTYLDPNVCSNLLSWLSTSFLSLLAVNYDIVNMTDSFAEVMFSNMSRLSFNLPDKASCVSLDSQMTRFNNAGFVGGDGVVMSDVRNRLSRHIKNENRSARVLDEAEVLQQMLEHYCLCWAYVDADGKYDLKNICFDKD